MLGNAQFLSVITENNIETGERKIYLLQFCFNHNAEIGFRDEKNAWR
jgi:hypothetical protein